MSQQKKTLTVGTPWRVILIFTIPLLIGNIVQQLYQVIDAMVVGQELGVNALAAVGATGSMLFLLMGFAWGMTSGFAIPTAQAFGAGDFQAVRRSVAAGTLLSAIVSVVLTALAPFVARPLLELMHTPAELLDDATTFAVISFLGAAATVFFNFLSAIIRAIGDSRTPLVFLVISCGINIALVIAFVKYLGYGVGGAAFATVLAQIISVALCFFYVRKALPVLHVQKRDWKVSRQEFARHLNIGIPMGFQASIIAIGTLAVQVKLNSLGTEAIAAYTAATRVDGLAVAFLASLGLAASTFVAQNYGAGFSDRIRVGVRQSLIMSVAGGLVLAVALIAAGSAIVSSFVSDGNTEVVEMAHWYLIVNGALYATLGVLFVTRGALQGMGRTLIPTLTGFMELAFRVAVAFILGGIYGFEGVVWGNPLAWLGALILLIPAWSKALKQLPPDMAGIVEGLDSLLREELSDDMSGSGAPLTSQGAAVVGDMPAAAALVDVAVAGEAVVDGSPQGGNDPVDGVHGPEDDSMRTVSV